MSQEFTGLDVASYGQVVVDNLLTTIAIATDQLQRARDENAGLKDALTLLRRQLHDQEFDGKSK